ncbi:MAG: DUF3240 family protein [Henriciella sp.]|uniref:DUF3240 family protein n=1 Tax=Henriciella sp. TaxID=1968823 RepID=UPI00261A28B2|nr:DUF3240 family protein [Henriciella sp.]
MDTDLCRLTLVYPPASEDAITEALLGMEPALPGFTTWAGAGHGFGYDEASHVEKVRGNVSRRVLTTIARRERIDAALEAVRTNAPIPKLMYWIEPVIAGGRLL